MSAGDDDTDQKARFREGAQSETVKTLLKYKIQHRHIQDSDISHNIQFNQVIFVLVDC